MASLKALKLRIGSVKSTQKITKAIKMVAAAKLRRAQQSAEAGRPYAERMSRSRREPRAQRDAGTAKPEAARRHRQGRHPPDRRRHRRSRPCGRVQHQHRPRRAQEGRSSSRRQGKTVLFYFVGRKGRPAFQRSHPKAIIGQHDTMAMKNPTYSDAQAIAEDILDRFESGQFDVAHLAYSTFQSALVQEPTVDQIIPVAFPPRDAAPKGSPAAAAIEYEPDEEEILAELLPATSPSRSIARCSRMPPASTGQQMTAMDNATRNAGDMINKLSIKYNRQRQAAITTELVEIISGAEAL